MKINWGLGIGDWGLVNATFTFCAAEGDPNPFNSQNEVKQYFDSINI